MIQQLVGVIYPGGTFVIANPNADLSILAAADQISNKINFNGDDPIQFVKVLNSIPVNIDSIEGLGQNPHILFDSLQLDTLDQIGIPGVDPGNLGYLITGGTTKNSTLRRNSSVNSGTRDWACGMKQWKTFAQDDISGLGSHDNDCKGNDLIIKFISASHTATEGVDQTVMVWLNLSGEPNSGDESYLTICLRPVADCLDPPDLADCGDDYTMSASNLLTSCPITNPTFDYTCWNEFLPDDVSGNFYFIVNIIHDYDYDESDEVACFRIEYTTSDITIDKNNDTHYVRIVNNSAPSQIQEVNNIEGNIKVFPTIVTESLNVEGFNDVNGLAISIFNILGENVKNEFENMGQGKAVVHTNSLAAGIYFIKVESGMTSILKKFIKEK